MSEFETDTLLDMVAAKHRCLMQLLALGRKQAEFIKEDNMTGLLDLLSSKQRVLLQLQRVEKGLDPFRDQDPERRRWRSSEVRGQCAKLLKECEAMLGEIIEQEKSSEDVLTKRRDDAATKLQGAHSAGIARGAYAAEAQQRTSRLDISSDS